MITDMLLTQIQETGSATIATLGDRRPLKASDLSEVCNTLGIPGDKLTVNALPCGALQLRVVD